MSIPKIPFYFLRHGETTYNNGDLITGQTDVPLTDAGRGQALAVSLCLPTFGTICCSPLTRTVETARIIGSRQPETPIKVIEGLKECNMGVLEGKTHQTLQAEWRKGALVEEAETVYDFDARVLEAVKAAVSEPGPVLVVAHGGVFKALLRIFHLETTPLPNCFPLFFTPAQEGWNLFRMDEQLFLQATSTKNKEQKTKKSKKEK